MNSDIILSIAIYIISGIFLIQSLSLSDGAETFPRIIAVLLIIMNTGLLRKAIKEKPTYEYNNLGRVLLIFGVVVLYAILISIIGFYTTTFAFIISVMYLLGYRKLKYMILVPAGVVAFTFIIFSKVFMIPVPTGLLI